MKQAGILRKCLAICCVVAVAGSLGCAFSLFPQPGALASKDSRVMLVSGETTKGSVATGDLKLDYELSYNGQEYTLDEAVTFDQSITYSFEKVKSFVVKMSFLDENGLVLENIDVTPHFSMFGSVDEKLTAKKSGVVPAGSTAVAFSWYGSFYTGLRDMSGSWDIHYFPFERQKR